LRGAAALTDAIRPTLGPKSKCVLIERKWGSPLVCDDGVTIAKEIELEDPEENLGARMLREAAEKTGEAVGDGTSTSTILAFSILSEGLRNVVAGASAIDVKRGLDRGARAAVAELRRLSRPVADRKERAQVANISAHGAPGVGEMVADAIEKVGSDGVITVEEAKSTETTLEVVEGLQFDRGYLSPYFVTDPEKMEAALDEPFILLHEKKISRVKEMLPLLEKVAKSGRPLLIVAEDIDGDALATLVVNKLRGTFACAAAKAPGYGDRRREMLDDMAVVTGGRLLTEDIGVDLEHVELADLGRARRAVVARETTTIIGGAGEKSAIAGRIAQLRKQIERTTSAYDKEKLEERLAKLSGGIGVIRVGAPTEAEMKNRKEALEDAIAATKAAVAEGIVPGAGLALLRAIDAVAREEKAASGDELTGIRILKRALEEPTRQIAANSGQDAGVIVDRMRKGTGAEGFDAAQCEFVDLIQRGIVDPTKVVRTALENAVSVAGVLLLTEATITETPEKKRDARAEEAIG
jgi:chaperonin GroEL